MAGFLRNVVQSSSGILVSRIFGLLRDISVAAYFGANALTDAFFVAYAIPNLFRAFFAEGALTSAFIPFLSDNMANDKRKADSYLTGMLFVLAAFVGAIVLLIILFPKPVIYIFMPGYHGSEDIILKASVMLRLVMPYLLFITICGLFTGYLYLYNLYFVPYSSTALLNISMIIGAYLGYRSGGSIFYLCWGVIFGGAFQLFYIFAFAYLKGFRFRYGGMHPDVRKTFRLLVPSLAGLGINQLYFTLGRIIASFLAVGSISYLYYADRIFQFPLGLFSIAVGSVSLTEISRANTAGDFQRRNSLIDKGIIAIYMIITPATLGLILLADSITSFIYARNEFTAVDVYNTAQGLVMFSVGMIFFSYVSLLAKVFFSEKDMKTPVRGAFIGLCVYAAANFMLIKPFGFAGIALASALSAAVNAGYLYSRLSDYRFCFKTNAHVIMKISAAAAVMALGLVIMRENGVHLLINISVCVALYFAGLRLSGLNIRRLLR
jgi:putative peptidoglycan lipid II flippase